LERIRGYISLTIRSVGAKEREGGKRGLKAARGNRREFSKVVGALSQECRDSEEEGISQRGRER